MNFRTKLYNRSHAQIHRYFVHDTDFMHHGRAFKGANAQTVFQLVQQIAAQLTRLFRPLWLPESSLWNSV
jgi:hypothetical protein